MGRRTLVAGLTRVQPAELWRVQGRAVAYRHVGAIVAVLALVPLLVHAAAADERRRSVQMAIAYGDGVEKHFTALDWKDGMTVYDALRQAAEHPRGIKFEHRGKEATAFLTSIDGVKNEGKGRNWTYQVNGELGDRSFAVFPLKAGDAVLWRFGPPR